MMQFVGPHKRTHSLDAKEAVRMGLDFRRLILTAFRYAVGELTDDLPENGPLEVLRGPEREEMLAFFRWVEKELRLEVFK